MLLIAIALNWIIIGLVDGQSSTSKFSEVGKLLIELHSEPLPSSTFHGDYKTSNITVKLVTSSSNYIELFSNPFYTRSSKNLFVVPYNISTSMVNGLRILVQITSLTKTVNGQEMESVVSQELEPPRTFMQSISIDDSKGGKRFLLKVQLHCNPDYYGKLCQNYCKPQPGVYSCDDSKPTGRACLPPFSGVNCDVLDACSEVQSMKAVCKKGSVCISAQNAWNYACSQNCTDFEKTKGPDQCDELSPSVKKDLLCGQFCGSSSYKCVIDTATQKPTCNCINGYVGVRCQAKSDYCMEQAVRMNISRPTDKNAVTLAQIYEVYHSRPIDLQAVCSQNGQCFNEKYTWQCRCFIGQYGHNCQYQEMGNVSAVFLVLVLLAVICFVFCTQRRRIVRALESTPDQMRTRMRNSNKDQPLMQDEFDSLKTFY